MDKFVLFSNPWWINFIILVPFIAYGFWHKKGLKISPKILIFAALFGIAFGFAEVFALIYLRVVAVAVLLHGYSGVSFDIARFSPEIYQQAQVVSALPKNLMTVEIFRETSTITMLLCVVFLAAKQWRERFALFLWTFAVWDVFFYIGLWIFIRWPSSLLSSDILFLIPVPWFSQVWYPLLISTLSMVAVLVATKKSKGSL